MDSKVGNLRKNPNEQRFKRQHKCPSGKKIDVGTAERVSRISYFLIFAELKGTTGRKQSQKYKIEELRDKPTRVKFLFFPYKTLISELVKSKRSYSTSLVSQIHNEAFLKSFFKILFVERGEVREKEGKKH